MPNKPQPTKKSLIFPPQTQKLSQAWEKATTGSCNFMLSGKIDRLANFAYEHLSDSSEEARLRFSIMLMDVIDSERNLSEAYADFLKSNEAFLKLGEEER